jgi:hypothetical protein
VSKLNTFLQILLAALGVLHLGIHPVPQWLLDGLSVAIVVTVFLSGAGYAREWGRRAAAKSHEHDR